MTELVDMKLKSNSCPWLDQIQSFDGLIREEESNVEDNRGKKLGWAKGVMVPCLLSIWGVMLFLKMPSILGHAGIWQSLVIIFISLIVILITTFSMSAVSTNGKVRGGGLYFIISRSIGPEFGASMGLLLALANTISAAMNTIGFCKTLKSLLNTCDSCNSTIKDLINENYRFNTLGVISIIIQSLLCCIGMDREAEVQNVLLVAIIVGIFNVVIGSCIGPTTVGERASGFTGFSKSTFKENWNSDYRMEKGVKQNIFKTFAVFFPSVTGIQAGANISGDLRDPSASIPKGTLLAILITITSYVVLIVVPGSVQLREASGIVDEYSTMSNANYSNCSEKLNRTCTKGLYHDENLMQSISLFPITIYLGCFGATISTALVALISVPKLLQRMGQDDVYPLLKYLAKGYGRTGEPYRAHILAMFVSSTILCYFGQDDLNEVASLISTIYLSAYAMLNFCTFHAEYYKPLGWRPSYKFYNKWLSLAGAFTCVSLMIAIDSKMSIVVAGAVCVLYTIAARKHDVLNWGSSKQTKQQKSVLESAYRLNTIPYHVKNFLPSVMVLSGAPESRIRLVSLGNLITKSNGLQTCVNVIKGLPAFEEKKSILEDGIEWLKREKVKSLYVVTDNVELDVAAHMVYNCGHGRLKPNIVLIGYKSDWLNCPNEELQCFFNVFKVANTNGIATIMVRVSSTESLRNRNSPVHDFNRSQKRKEILFKATSASKKTRNQHKVSDNSVGIKDRQYSFTGKRPHSGGTVDVWWVYNDGGLSLLLTYILRSSATWKNCKFRIFGVTDKFECLFREKIRLKQLLSMYRVHFDHLDIILANAAFPTTKMYFTSLLERSASKANKFEESSIDRFTRTLFLRDLIKLHSDNSDLIVLSTPRCTPNTLFMCWIETVTRDLPPCIVINGDTGPVLTANA